jgi:hypothetical protein
MSNKRNIFEPTTAEKIAEWVGKRYALILGASSLAVLISAIALIKAEQSKTEQLRAWQNIAIAMSNKVIVATVDGRVALVDKKPLQPEIAKAVVNTFVREHFLFDIEHLFGGINSQGTRANNFTEFLKTSPLVKDWLALKVLTESSVPQFKSILQFYWGLLNSQKLLSIPYTIYYKQVKNEDFRIVDKEKRIWKYTSDWIAEITYIKPDNTLGIGSGTTHVELVGVFQPFNGNHLNPLGIKLLSIKFKPVLSPIQ